MADNDYRQDGATSIISMLGSIVAALGFEITDNAKAAVTMLKMQRDLMLDSTMRDYLTGQYTLKTLQNIATGAWYVPGKLISWVQRWLASDEGGGYPGGSYKEYTYPNIYDFTGMVSNIPVWDSLNVNGKISIDTFKTHWPDDSFELNDGVWFIESMYNLRSGHDTWYVGLYLLRKLNLSTLTNVSVNYIRGYSVELLSDGSFSYNNWTNGVTLVTGKQANLYHGTIPVNTTPSSGSFHQIIVARGSFVAGGGVTRGGGTGRPHGSLPKDENFPPCGGDTTVPQITEWSGRVINWNDDCYMPLTYYKVNPSNENPGTEPGSPNTPIDPDDPRLDPESPVYTPSIPGDIIKYFYPEDYVQSTPQNGDNTVQTTGQLKGNYTNANNGPSDIPNTDIKGGLYTLWHPSADNLQKLGAFLYGGTTQGTIASIIGDPINAIIQLTEWAVTPVDGPVKSPVICNIGATELKMPTIPNQFMQFDCGTIEIPREYHDFRDYEPYTRLSLFLPFVGDVNISTNDCITPHKIHVIYNIDFLSGVACAEVLIDEDVRYAYQAAMCAAVPVTSSDASRLIASIIGAAVGTVSGGVMGGIVGGTAGSRMAARSLIGGVSEVAMSPINGIQTQRTGSISANTGLLGEMKPYVLVTRPISVVADQYKSLLGQPYQLDGTLGSQKGFVKVREVHLDGVTATETEKTEIERLLKEGVIL